MELQSKSKGGEWVTVTVYVLSQGSWLLSISSAKISPLQACQSCDPRGFTHLLSAIVINNDDNNNSKGHKAHHTLWMIHSFDLESMSSLVSFKTGNNSTKKHKSAINSTEVSQTLDKGTWLNMPQLYHTSSPASPSLSTVLELLSPVPGISWQFL